MLLVAEHESGELRELDLATGNLSKPTKAPPPARDPLERLYPKDARGRWQVLGGITVVLYRVATRLHLRTDAQDIEISPAVRLFREENADTNALVATRDGTEILRVRYPSQRGRMTLDSFIDPYESEDDFDLVLFAVAVAGDEGRRKRMFATEEEIRLGDVTLEDELLAAREALTGVFTRRRVLDTCREATRWTWRWSPAIVDGWGPSCTLCGKSSVARSIARFRRSPNPLASMDLDFETDLGICGDCLTIARGLLAAASPPRADIAVAEVARALRARGALRDDEIAERLTERASAVPAEPVSAPGPACSWCRKTAFRSVPSRDARICEWCVDAMRETWRRRKEVLVREPTGIPSRWERAGYVLCLDGRRSLRMWVTPIADQPVEILASELERWECPHDEEAVDERTRERFRREISAIVRETHRRDVVFLEGE